MPTFKEICLGVEKKTYIFLAIKFLKMICTFDMHLKQAKTQRFAPVIHMYK